MTRRLEGKVAFITGASRGLGEYCAVGYGREGAKVAIAARTEEVRDPRLPGTIHHAARLVQEAGGEALPVVCNVADPASIAGAVEAVLERWGRIDILMNNAAIQPPGGNADVQAKHWRLMYRVNVHGCFDCVRAVLPTMRAQGSGNIINISSAATLGGTPYGGSKRAVEALTEGLAHELAAEGIVVNALKPVGAIETPGFLFAQVTRDDDRSARNELPPKDSYVEAAVLLALQTPQSFTGRVHNDAQIIGYLADEETKERFREMNPKRWVTMMESVDA